MSRASVVLVALLVASNAAWWSGLLEPPDRPADAEATEVERLRARVRDLEAGRVQAPSLSAAEPAAGPPPPPALPPPPPPPPAAPVAAKRPLDAEAEARRRRFEADRKASQEASRWRADVLQIEDPARREAGLRALTEALASRDTAVLTATLRAFQGLRDVPFDRDGVHDLILPLLRHEDVTVRGVAAAALHSVQKVAGDRDLVLAAAEEMPEAAFDLLPVALWMSDRRVEGRLAALYATALGGDDARRVENLANHLRGAWIAPEVERALVEAFGRLGRERGRVEGAWVLILAQARPVREPRLATLFELFADDRQPDATAVAPALLRELEESARPAAARLAAETLPRLATPERRRLLLEVLRTIGTREQADAVRAFAENPMLSAEIRTYAADVAVEIGRR